MFDDILNSVRGAPTDLSRIVVQHNGLNNPIVIPLQPWKKLDSDVVMNGITNVLNSNKELIVGDSLSVTVGSIAMPQGNGSNHLPITSLFCPGNSMKRKKSIFEVTSDSLCLLIAIATCFLKTCNKLSMTANETNSSIFENAIKYRTCSEWQKRYVQKLAYNKKCTNVFVISSKLGNKFIRVTYNSDLPNIFIYLVENGRVQHYHGIASITVFFGASYFCEACLKPYSHKETHSCERTCSVCGHKDCATKQPMSCLKCNR